LYRLEMNANSSLIDHEQTFEDLVQSLADIGETIKPGHLIVIYANSLPVDVFSNWIQGQMAFIDKMTVMEFKGRVREEARRLNACGLNQGLGIERNPDTIQANIARSFPRENKTIYPHA